MSIIIKDMNKPVSCWRCPFCLTVDPETYRCMPTGKSFEATFDAIDNVVLPCPINDAPPRLANIDVLIDRIRMNMELFGNDYLTSLAAVENFLCHAPLVIDEEEENEHTD